MNAKQRHLPALATSATLHLALAAFVLAATQLVEQEAPPREEPLRVSLSMFAPPPAVEVAPPPRVELPPEPILAPAPEPPPVPRNVARPEPKPEPKPPPKRAAPRRETTPTAPAPEISTQTPPPVYAPAPQPAPIAEPRSTPAPTPATDSAEQRRIEEAYKSTLRAALEAGKRYPSQARRLRHEGEVVLGFTLHRNGTIGSLRIVNSSGSDFLDEAALEAVRGVDGRLPFPVELARQNWTFTIPLNYSLR
ncbi:MAG: energy transducer TonB [Thiotrichales bacterium]